MDRRSRFRIPTAARCRIRFQGEERGLGDIRVTNLGTGGCCLRISRALPGDMEGRNRLESVELDLPDLPRTALSGQVVWWRRAGWRGQAIEAGVAFRAVPRAYAEGLERLVKQAGPEVPFWLSTGMP